MAERTRNLDLALAASARRQHGVVARDQLLALGFTRHMIQRLIGAAILTPIHPGIYLVLGAAGSPWVQETAAILGTRPRSLLSHRTAARLWGLPVPEAAIEVTVVGRSRRSLVGVRVRSPTRLARGELRHLHGLPLTSPSLTLLDLAGRLDGRAVARALNEARVRRLVSDSSLRAGIAHHPKRRGGAALRRLLDRERGPMIIRSEAERRALEAMREQGLAPDASDVEVGPCRVDFLFRRERLVVEVDGYRYHSTPGRFAGDRRRVAELAARGFAVFPLTWIDLAEDRVRAMGRLRDALMHRRAMFVPGD